MKQRYTFFGLLIVIAMGWTAAWLIWEAFTPHPYERPESAEFAALRVQCKNIDGMIASANGPEGTYVTCYQGKRKAWWVKL